MAANRRGRGGGEDDDDGPLESGSVLAVKFPRTRHLLNVGGASRDDLIMDATEAEAFLRGHEFTLEEKIDGANLGISLNPEPSATNPLLFQNRSHLVTHATSAQWKGLDQWVVRTPGLYQVLTPDIILFGEWMAAKHTIHYTRLSGSFIAFDIYNKKEQKFVSAEERDRMLEGSGIPIVPKLAHGVFTKDDIMHLIDTQQSQFYDGPLEGVYLRRDSGRFLEARAKVVRADFLPDPNVTHWSKNVVVKNIVDYSYGYA
eukprot:TRINITY_DN7698_c0_g1_i1.p1 TRINITY_DN7698_c0_g1~~TRINITY_DN7698_c0_g1_i1.p1  ORF type:complete len:266 (+),score=63.56 TRINITY_DN7698_c0_g1_i1:26-799(+)